MDANEIFDRLMKMRQRIERDIEEPLLDSDNALLYDVAQALGLSDEQALELAPDTKRYAIQQPAPIDFDRSGLGIGGAGSHSLHDEALDLIARGEMTIKETTHKGPMPSGQLWEPCSRRGCNIEPVCLDCGYCERHCGC